MSRLHHSNYQPRDSLGRFDKQLRTHRVTFRLTDDEYHSLKSCADYRNWSMTQFIASCATVNYINDEHQREARRLRSAGK